MSDLLKINVNEHTEKKNNLTYLSWAWAWAEVLKVDPVATWWAHDYTAEDGKTVPYMLINGTAMVKTTVKLKDIERECLLPVMDHRNKAIKDPDAFAVNTAIMRCMTKAISMHGLGLYIYAGEDLPEGDEKADGSLVPVLEASVAAAKANAVEKPNFPKVADLVLADNEELTEEIKSYLVGLAASIVEHFPKSGPIKTVERIDAEGLDAVQYIFMSNQLPTPMRNAIKTASAKLHQKEPA